MTKPARPVPMADDIHTVLFDLDGTLADTAPDLACALNTLLDEERRRPLPFESIRPVVSHGSPALIRLGFGLAATDAGYAELRARLLAHYAAGLCRDTRLFPGTAELLASLKARGIKWGIVTNKPAFLTEPLVRQLAFVDHPPCCIVSGDTVANRKPHPEPMLLACKLASGNPAQCVYIGDAERDVRAGKDAGMHTLVALFGYIGENEAPAQWGADGMINTPLEILDWLDRRGRYRNVGR